MVDNFLNEYGMYIIFVVILTFCVFFYLKYKKGKIEINLNTYTLKPGENFTGSVTIKLFKHTDINSFIIAIIGQEVISYRRKGRRKSQTRSIFKSGIKPIYNQALPAGHESTYDFNFIAPNPNEFISLKDKTEYSLYDKLINFLRQEERKIEWYITAEIDAKGIDLDSREQIFINKVPS